MKVAPPMFVLITLVVLGLLAQAAATQETPAAAMQRAEQLLDQGKAQEALQVVENLRRPLSPDVVQAVADQRHRLPPEARLARWRVDMSIAGIKRALIGRKHVYLVANQVRRGQLPVDLVDKRPILNETGAQFDFHEVILCLDTASGAKLWVRQTAGRMSLALDPQTDDLYCWRDNWPNKPPHVFRLQAATGNVLLDKALPKSNERLQGLLIGGRLCVDRDQGLRPDQEQRWLSLYNTITDKVEAVDYTLRLWLSPDEKKRLVLSAIPSSPTKRAIHCRLLNGGDLWKYEEFGNSPSDPFWYEDDVITMNGNPHLRSAVVRLDGATGRVVWRFPLPRGPYRAAADPFLASWDWRDDWDACQAAGGRLLVLGGDGKLFFLNGKTGKVDGAFTPSRSYLALPRIVGDSVILCTPRQVRAVPLKLALSAAGVDERRAVVLQARCLDALGKTRDALELLRDLLGQYPEYTAAWTVKGQLCRKANLPFEEIDARCRLLELLGQETDPELSERYGLIRRIATGQKITAPMVLVGDRLFAGTVGGWLYELDVQRAEVVQKQELPSGVYRLWTEVKLKGVLEQGDLPERKDPATELPAEFTAYDHDNGGAVTYRGKVYRPRAGGEVLVLSAGKVQKHRTALRDIKGWSIYVGRGGPLGYGSGGVYELDENLCPKRDLIDLGGFAVIPRPWKVQHLASDGRTIALVANVGAPVLQIWTRDGKKKLREVNLQSGPFAGGSLLSQPGGYLFTSWEVVWAPTDLSRPVRHFFPQRVPLIEDRFGHNYDHGFGAPVVAGNHVFVAHNDGAIYVFDLGRWVAGGEW